MIGYTGSLKGQANNSTLYRPFLLTALRVAHCLVDRQEADLEEHALLFPALFTVVHEVQSVETFEKSV